MKKILFPLLAILLIAACEKETVVSESENSQDLTSITGAANLRAGNKVDVCHNGNIINININAVPAHQAHGDAVDMDGDGFFDLENDCSEGVDCNDSDSAINPDAEEICDAIDNNCDGNVDEGLPTSTYYADADGDGYGDPATAVTSCAQPSGYISQGGDCDDSDASINPGAEEICGDGIDQNCDGNDEECTCPCFDEEDLELVAWTPRDCAGWGPCLITTGNIVDNSCGGPIGQRGIAAAGCGFMDLPGSDEAWLIDYVDGSPNWTPATKPECGNLQEGEILACQQLICEKYEELTGVPVCDYYINNNLQSPIQSDIYFHWETAQE